MARHAGPVTQEMADEFKRVQAGTSNLARAALTLGLAPTTAKRRYKKWSASGGVLAPCEGPSRPKRPVKTGKPVGIDGFRALFSPSKRGHDAIDKLINSELKERGWIYDTEMRSLSRVDSIMWTNLRRDYEQLLIEVRDPENGSRKTVWCHPDIVEDAREIAKERAR